MPKTWLITGCATGFGALLAQEALNRGETVIATDYRLEALAHLTTDDPDRLLALQMDVSDDEQVRAAVAQAVEQFGRIDVLVNNAGLGHGGPFEEVDMATVRKLFDVNIIGMMSVTQAVLPHMREAGGGHIVNLSSDSGQVGFPFQNVYTATKFGVEGFSECLAHEVYSFNIKVSVIEPCGAFDTAMPKDAVAQAKMSIPPESPYYETTMAIAAGMEGGHFTDPIEVPLAILEVVEMETPPFRRRVGPDDRTGLLSLKRQLPDEEFFQLIRSVTATGHESSTARKTGQGNGGDLIVRTLVEGGVDTMFTIVGGHNYEMVNAAKEQGMTVIDVRHEQAAAHMADAYARFARKPGAVALDAAPGLVNAFPGIQVAYESQVPMVVVTAQGSLAGRDIGVMQAIDQLEITRPITKWQRTCFDAKRLPEYTATALRYAQSGRPGPVFLDFPLEVMRGTVDMLEVPSPRGYNPASRAYGDIKKVREALDLLSQSERPMIIAGSGVWWSHAEEELVAFVEATGIPIMTRNVARGIIPDSHPLAAGFMPYPSNLADTFLVIGTRLDWTIGYGQFPLWGTDARVIHVDIKPEVMAKTRPVDVGIFGDAKAVLTQLLEELDGYAFRVSEEYQQMAHMAIRQARQDALESTGVLKRDADLPIHTLQLVHEYGKWVSDETITVVDGGYSAAFAIEQLDSNSHGGVTWVGSTGHLGVGVPYANAAKLTNPGRPVVAFMGDGAFGLCGMEFDTAVRHNLPIVVVVANDAGWGETRDGQRKRWGEDNIVATQLAATRYDQLAVALGGHGELVETIDELCPALDRAAASGKPAIVNVLTDPNQRSAVVSGLPWIIE